MPKISKIAKNETLNVYILPKGGFPMLGPCTSHKQFLRLALRRLNELAFTRPDQIREYKKEISKMFILNLDPMAGVIQHLYPPMGRAAMWQVEIFRSFVLMDDLGIPLNLWVQKLHDNPVLRIISGFFDTVPGTSSFYDFINRVFPLDERPRLRSPVKKPKLAVKPKKGEKLPPKNPGIVAKLVSRILVDEERFSRQLSRRPERFLQKIFARVSVDASVKLGLVDTSPDVSGDGTCIKTGASIYGKKVCGCKKAGIFKCGCDRKYSDPSANWGWDSHEERFFYGHSGYFISTYNKTRKVDLPLYLRLVQASRHDSVSAVFSLAEFKGLYPGMNIATFISDSASDNFATYKLLDTWGVDAVIALNNTNKDNFRFPQPIGIDDKGTPICPAGRKMRYNGHCKGRRRHKWRCPRVVEGLVATDSCMGCSDSGYGRVVYTKQDDDLRLFTRIPRGSDAWKDKMKQRTASERVNNRILNDYGASGSRVRGKKRISFFVTLAAINIHLDAQLKFLEEEGFFDFNGLIPNAAC